MISICLPKKKELKED